MSERTELDKILTKIECGLTSGDRSFYELARDRLREHIKALPLEKVKGRFRCDFCHEESRDLVKLRFPGVIFTPCPKCLKKIQRAIQAWYNWSQELLIEKSMLETMKKDI